jgi:hypothetical protein
MHAVSFPIDPGAVKTDMMDDCLKDSNLEAQAPPDAMSIDESVKHVLARIDEETRERNVLIRWNGEVIPW